MAVHNRIELCALMSALCASTVACNDASTSPQGLQGQPHFSLASAPLTPLTGRIVYTLSGNLRIYNVATRVDASLGTSGVNPKFSPDGTLIVYQGGGGIRVMNSDGSGNRVLTATGGVPAFDPTGRVVAYNDNGIWKINVDGTARTQLTTDGGHQPAWSPGGGEIAYHRGVNGIEQLYIMNVDGSNPHQALSSAAIIDVVWQPSGKLLFGLLAARNDYELYSYDPGSSSLRRLTTLKGSDFEPSWSPDASGISWTSSGGIWIMNADGSSQQGPVIAKGRQGSWGK